LIVEVLDAAEPRAGVSIRDGRLSPNGQVTYQDAGAEGLLMK
jgi:hypothetical protein